VVFKFSYFVFFKGWALTMLKRENVGHASTCNSVGQTAGYFLGYVMFIALESKDFCNTYLRTVPEDEGLITLPGFLWFWGITFLVTTTLVAILKRENEHCDNNHRYTSLEDPELNIKDSYFQLFSIIKMKPILLLSAILLTVKIAFAACDAVTSLKLIDDGVPKDKMALLAVPLVPLQIILPLIISKYTAGNRPMEVYIKAIPYRLTFTVLIALLTWFTPMLITRDHVPTYYYVLLLGIYAFYQVRVYHVLPQRTIFVWFVWFILSVILGYLKTNERTSRINQKTNAIFVMQFKDGWNYGRVLIRR
jgi:MFS transporter, PAT family, solute carrier family 33 (acetyl-CoA transportor), member 1